MHQKALFSTSRAAQLVQTMRQHFAHKVAVTQTPTGIEIGFDGGTAQLDAGNTAVAIVVKAANNQDLTELSEVVERHLLHFAYRDAPQPLVWSKRHNEY